MMVQRHIKAIHYMEQATPTYDMMYIIMWQWTITNIRHD